MRVLLFVFVIAIFSPLVSIGQTNKGDLKVIVKNIKNTKGFVLISLFNSPSGFPKQSEKALKMGIVNITGSSVEYIFKDIDFGVYAVTAHHDENGNKKIDTNFIGIPTEGLGVSNGAKGSFGPPKFNDAKFNFNKNKQITITFKYL